MPTDVPTCTHTHMTDGRADEHMHGRTVARTHACTHACPQVHPISVGGKTFYDLDLATAKRLVSIPLHHGIMLHKKTLTVSDKHDWASRTASTGCVHLPPNEIRFFYVRYTDACMHMCICHSYI